MFRSRRALCHPGGEAVSGESHLQAAGLWCTAAAPCPALHPGGADELKVNKPEFSASGSFLCEFKFIM